ncbi:alpha/beta hydrolase [Anaerobacillus isosaccharinicus]|uniref:Alpha/beta hydrolase n=1 Tax=Anaerobacillus isosaccharinicus TaxID=1532552 RepID=A0A1S2LFD4_9BACI|nr:alpha/beta hydrolase-fold protein [Anaerobacillus isosaccharinicus]MBA5586285.1 alpha/beta hydrolase [Anaerobacillus isosaccharinicus]QOY35464.1 alpha/beta hydrolase [Anaerobacillus isosaccharinicus]
MFEHFEVTITPLNRKRMVRIYLPKSYHHNEEKSYPVLYMHDGQNLFKDEDAGFGVAWGISDFLEKSTIELIVVGIDCNNEGFKRLDEYGPWKSQVFHELLGETGGEGKDYIDFIVRELKPLIDEKYRTKPEDTSMAGSSMGGLISTYAACTYPHVFRKIASVSSAYWFNQAEIEDLIKQSDLSAIEKFYLDIGTHEVTEHIDCKRYVESSEAVYSILKEKVKNCRFEIIDEAVHNEAAWKKRVPTIFSYLFS